MRRRVTVHRSHRRLLNPSRSPTACEVLVPLIQLQLALARPTRQPLNTLIPCSGDARRHRRRFFRYGLRERAEPRSNLLPKEIKDRTRDRRHASANPPNITLKPAPQRDSIVVVRCVGDFAELCQVLQANDAADRNKKPQKEGENRADLAPFILDLQCQELRHREEEDDEVEEDVESAVDVDPFLEGQAGPWMLAVPLGPEERDGSAFEGEVDDEGEAVARQAGYYCPAGVGEAVRD